MCYNIKSSRKNGSTRKGYVCMGEQKVNVVTVRWWDDYKEDFRATEVRFGSDLLWMRLEDGNNRHIPLRMVRWFGTSIESHQNTGM